jgi:hypothetical protein
MFYKSLLLLSLLLVSIQSLGQTDNEIINSYLERYIENSEDEVDMQQFIADLTYYLEEPLNLNTATADELFKAVFLTPLQALEILQHRQKYGDFLSIYELQLLERFELEEIQSILPFVTLQTGKASFNIPKLMANAEQMLLSLAEVRTPKARGYLPRDSGENRYAGSMLYNNLRYRFNSGRKLQFGFNAEKDAGETFFNGNPLGFDYVSAYFGVKDIGKLENLQIGDFQANFGQGLTLSNGLAFGKSSIITQSKRSFNGFDTYRSLRENAFLRGISTSFRLQQWKLGGFVSSKKMDANVAVCDTAKNPIEFSSIQEEGGFHRTANEIADKDALQDQQAGLFAEFHHPLGKIGLISTARRFSSSIIPDQQAYNQFRFKGTSYVKSGLYYDLYLGNVNLFGEVSAQDFENQMAQSHGALIALGRRLSLTFLHRNYNRGFIRYQTNGFGEGSNTQNEIGFYTGFDFRINSSWKILGYYDVYRNPWIQFRTNSPSNGDDFWLELEYKPSRAFAMYYRYRTETKYRNFASTENTVNVMPFTLVRHRIHLSYQINQALSVRTRAEWNTFLNNNTTSHGSLIFQDVRYKPFAKPFQVIGRIAWTNLDNFENRIYAFENVPLYDYPLYVHTRNGLRSYLMIRYMPSKQLNFWLRVAHNEDQIPLTALNQEVSIGSGLEERSGNSQQTITLQIRYLFK